MQPRKKNRAKLAGCSDALTYLGEAAVLSVGTLFQAAIIPGIMLAALYGIFAFGYALFNPKSAPSVVLEGDKSASTTSVQHKLFWFLGVPAIGLVLVGLSGTLGLAGSQTININQGLVKNSRDFCERMFQNSVKHQ